MVRRAMEPFNKLEGVAAPLPMINVDTDMIIPKQYPEDHPAHRPRQEPVRRDALHARRQARSRTSCSTSRPTARPRSWWPATISAAARAASTRPGRCSISASAASSRPAFADIFYNNCFKNGILPITLPQEEVDKLMDDAERGANAVISDRPGEAGDPRPRRRHASSSRSTPSASRCCSMAGTISA